MRKARSRAYGLAGVALSVATVLAGQPRAQEVIENWGRVAVPPPPALATVTLDPKTTALLVLDLATPTCNADSRPRCLAMLPRLQPFLAKARDKRWFVVYTLSATATPADIAPAVKPTGSEPIVKGFPDKFLGTDLEHMLRERGVKTVVVIGYASNGAVLHTAASASFRGFDVVVPVDGMAAENAYAEQFAVWDLAHAPRLNEHVKLSALDRIE
jgi:nicotinamidase-related amidase